ncbi:tetratricopeptide repeat protein [Pseudogemmobacter sp. W21_MBD1_M6]|uniref:tetratricopeptide repeat protein n=1 Tax=Pseudogemmobacter sp. W21_MBD1_M6 TaxID=3240271 RepID=UPI003F970FFD
MKRIVFLLFLASPAFAQTCPVVTDQDPRKSELMSAVKDAPNEMEARALTNQLWEIWSKAPDAVAQEMLDRGMKHRAAYDFDAAIVAFDALIAYCPGYAEGYNQRAFVNFLRMDYPLAVGDLEKALELAPDHIAAMAGLALTLQGLGRTKAAQSALREALKLNPWLPERNMISKEPGVDL